jgi:four helix bundle protein
MPSWDLVERTRVFALDVLSFCRRLPPTNESRDAGRQLLRAATSVRSNYRSARRSRSRAEFRSKLHVAFEEADECVDWLEYLRDAGIQHDTTLVAEAQQIARILAAAVRSARRPAAHR